MSADIPASVATSRVRLADLPTDWRRDPAPEAVTAIGTRWAAERKTAVLAVPSAIIPQEANYLLNPALPTFRQIRVGKPEPFVFDRRMWRR